MGHAGAVYARPDGVLFNIQQSSTAATQRHDPAESAEKRQISSVQPIRRVESHVESEQSRGLPGDNRLDAGRLYRLTAAKPIGRYCQIEIPPDGTVWALCINV